MKSNNHKSFGRELFLYARAAFVFGAAVVVLLVAVHFPRDFDPQQQTSAAASGANPEAASGYYEQVYTSPDADGGESGNVDSEYVEINRGAAHALGIEEMLTRFAGQYRLQDAKVLEVGAGSGTLQDIVEDYTGLDIAANASRYFHKRFVQGSATDLPFPDSSFDSIWTVWTIEHVPNPERAFSEMRRVARKGGILFLYPAWNVAGWIPEGLNVRPFSDLNWSQKLIKLTLPVRDTQEFHKLYRVPIRGLRWLYWELSGTPTVLRYTRLEPNYKDYWATDSDAVNSLDSFESLLWFTSRGDECLNCGSIASEITSYPPGALVVKVNKN